MKAFLLLIGALLLAPLSRAADIRTIGNKSVDLQPIHEWQEGGQQGERSLKHWKEVEILEWLPEGPHGHPLASIRISNAEPNKVWLKNCPKQLVQDFAKIAELEKQQAAVEKLARATAAKADAAKATYTAGTEEKISADLAQMRTKLASENKVLAMDTGTVYGGEPIWDTGLVGR